MISVKAGNVYYNDQYHCYYYVSELLNDTVMYRYQSLQLTEIKINKKHFGVGSKPKTNMSKYKLIKQLESLDEFVLFLESILETRVVFK